MPKVADQVEGLENSCHAFETNQGLPVAIYSVLLRYQSTNDGAEMFPLTSTAPNQNQADMAERITVSPALLGL